MSARALTWVVNNKGDRTLTRQTSRANWALLELLADLADDHGVYEGGLELLAERFGRTKRHVQYVLDRLEAGEFILRRKRYREGLGSHGGHKMDAIIFAPFYSQTQRRPMLTIPKALRPEDD